MYTPTMRARAWTYGDEEVTDFNIVKKGTDPKLLTRSRDKPLKLYPYWYTLLYLDDVYPGNIRHIQVLFWADTGELIDCQPVSFGGNLPIELENTSIPSSIEQIASPLTEQNVVKIPSTYTLDIAVAIVTMLAIAIITMGYKKKHK